MASTQHLSVEKRNAGNVTQEFGPCINLVLFGMRQREKSSAAESILGRAELPAASRAGQCEKHQAEVCGRWVTLVELPPLSGKPLDTVMQQCHHCLSLCAPEGVHAFILVLPLGSLTDKDKDEMKRLQDTLSSQVLSFSMIVFTVDSDLSPDVKEFVKHREIQDLCESFGGGYRLFNIRDQQHVPELLKSVETLRNKNKPHSFTTETLIQVQMEKISLLQKELKAHRQSSGDVRIAVIGKTGSGKSASGNTILGRKEFETKASQNSITQVCKRGETEIDGKSVYVVDTPGLFDTTMSEQEVMKEIKTCVSLLAPGPHIFLLVLKIGRFTKEEEKTLKLIQERFGKDLEKYTIVLFTHGDTLHESIEKYKENDCSKFVQKFISKCGDAYHVFNNSSGGKDTQVTDTQVTDTQVTDTQVKDTQVKDTQETDTQVTDTQVKDTQVKDTQVKDTQETDTQVKDTQVTDTQVTDTQVTDTQVTDTQVKELMEKIYLKMNKNNKSCYTFEMLLETQTKKMENMEAQLREKEIKIKYYEDDIRELEDKLKLETENLRAKN